MRAFFMSIFLFSLLFSQKIKGPGFIAPKLDNFEILVEVVVKDSIDTLSGKIFFIYTYTVINKENSMQPVDIFEIPWFTTTDTFPKGFYRYPKGDTSFSKDGYYTVSKRASWLHLEDHLQPGDTVKGLIFITHELPDISYWYAEGEDTTMYTPILLGEEYEDSLDKYYYSKTPFGPGRYGRTVGPGPLPPGFWSGDRYLVGDSGFYHLSDRVERCYTLGWITREQVKDHLIRMIERAHRHFQNYRISQCIRTLTQIMDYIERQRGVYVKDEAYYVLYYRTKFVRDHLMFQPEKQR